MKLAVVVGTSHDIQRGENLKGDFKSYLIDLCEKHNIKVIAEEINDDADFVVAKNVCHSLDIEHKSIEPNPTEYDNLGIKQIHTIIYEVMNKYNLKPNFLSNDDTPTEAINEYNLKMLNEHCHPREVEWLKRIQEHDHWPVLVICGSNHFESFFRLLSGNNITVTTGESNWGSLTISGRT